MNSRQRIKVLKMYGCYIKGNKYSKGDIKSLFRRYENLRQMTSLGYSYRNWIVALRKRKYKIKI